MVTREEAKEEIESLISRMVMQAQGLMDYLHQTTPEEAAEHILDIAEQIERP